MPLVLGCDIDGPLLDDRTFSFIEFVNSKGRDWDYGVLAETGRWDLAAPGEEDRTINELFAEFCGLGDAIERVTPGAVEALGLLLRGNGGESQLMTITTRPEAIKHQTVAQLKRHFPPFHDHHFGCKGEKHERVRRAGATLFVEDNVNEVTLVAKGGQARAILFPMRGRGRPGKLHSKVIVLGAEAKNCPGVDDDQWGQICTEAWSEIVEEIIPRR
jgi:hypothetical protein